MLDANLEVHVVAQLELVAEVGLGRAGVEEVVGVVLPRDVAEPELALGVDRQPGGVIGMVTILFKVNRQLLTNYLNLLSVSLLMTSLTALANEGRRVS